VNDTDRHLAEVPVHAAVLHATADLMEILRDFFAEADPGVRIRLGAFLIERYGEENTTDTGTEALVMLGELGDAAELLHALAGDDIDQE
jgi:hypothetical protein